MRSNHLFSFLIDTDNEEEFMLFFTVIKEPTSSNPDFIALYLRVA